MTTQDARIASRIARTGFVICYPAIEALAQGEQWFLCNDRGFIQPAGKGYSAEACRELVKAGALVEHETLESGCVIYKQVTP
jgi:hypothetical protein